jgi:hypothetical protein
MSAVIAAVAGLRLGGFAGTAIAVGTPAVLAVVYGMIALSIGVGGWVIWRGIPVDIDEKLNVGVITEAVVSAIERVAARFNIRLDLMRKLENIE